MLLFATLCALTLANSEYQEFYFSINELKLKISLGEWPVSHSLKHWVNDGFVFFLLGMEIKRELLIASLAFVGLPEALTQAKLGIMFGSLIAGIAGDSCLLLANKKEKPASP